MHEVVFGLHFTCRASCGKHDVPWEQRTITAHIFFLFILQRISVRLRRPPNNSGAKIVHQQQLQQRESIPQAMFLVAVLSMSRARGEHRYIFIAPLFVLWISITSSSGSSSAFSSALEYNRTRQIVVTHSPCYVGDVLRNYDYYT